MEQAPQFTCTHCGQSKPHDIVHFWTKTGYVRKREIGKLPTTVCRECVRKKMSLKATKRWHDEAEFKKWADKERALRLAKAVEAQHAAEAVVSAQEANRAENVIVRTDHSELTLEERKKRAKPIDI